MTTIIIKNSSTSSAVPGSGDLTKGELAVNVTDKKLYTKDNGGSVVKLVGGLGNQEANAVAITGGSIDGTPIGGTTASTASFTTLSASGNVTLSGGTANGVLYLNGSKVATSGSALTFDGSSLAVTLGSTTTPSVRLYYNGSSQYGLHSMNANGDYVVESPALNGVTSGQLYLKGNAAMIFGVNSSEQMRLTSTGLGIGTSSPAVKLHSYTSGNTPILSETSGGITSYLGLKNTGGMAYIASQNNNILFATSSNADTRATLDSSGNLGLGVTPSAWTNSFGVIQGLGGWSISHNGANSNSVDFLSNAYRSGGTNTYLYLASANATRYQQLAGAHVWYTAASGTAGNAISFTQAMTLDASGNLALGQTTASFLLDLLSGTSPAVRARTGNSNEVVRVESAGTTLSLLRFINTAANNIYLGADSGSLIVSTGGSERARIDSSGNLLVGTTSTNPTNGFVANTNGGNGFYIQIGHPTGTTSGVAYARFMYNQTEIGSITQSGTTAVLYNITSDQRLKENIADADSASSLIDALQVRKFDWKADGNHQRYGFVAQELVTVAPEAVHQPADPEQMMAVDYSKLVPMLVKEIQSLRARVAALES